MTRKTYKYTIELTEPIYPRHLADYMTMQPMFARQLLSVQDLQRSDHWYADNNQRQSDTYQVSRDEQESEQESTSETSYEHVLGYYAVKREQAETTPAKDAYTWILSLLKQNWVNHNMGLLTAYLKEFSITLQEFRSYCERIGKFSEEESEG